MNLFRSNIVGRSVDGVNPSIDATMIYSGRDIGHEAARTPRLIVLCLSDQYQTNYSNVLCRSGRSCGLRSGAVAGRRRVTGG
jgi:hypothetical protein